MRAPQPDAKGVRWYGATSLGRTKENVTRCVEEVAEPGRYIHFHQCNRKRGHGPDGLYCKIHDPAYVEQRRRESNEKWKAKMEAHHAPWKRIKKLAATLKQEHAYRTMHGLEPELAEREAQRCEVCALIQGKA